MSHSKELLRSPLSRVRGLGSAKDGTAHWVWQRLSALVILPLSLWLVYHLLMTVMGSSQEAVAAWIGQPFSAIALALLLVAACAHAKLGVQVIIEDYVHGHAAKILLLVLNMATFWIVGMVSLLAIIKLHLG